jgi:hypothetical protein
MTKKKLKDELQKKLSPLWRGPVYILRWHLKELLLLIIVLLIFYIAITSGYNKKDGFYKKATDTKLEFKK